MYREAENEIHFPLFFFELKERANCVSKTHIIQFMYSSSAEILSTLTLSY